MGFVYFSDSALSPNPDGPFSCFSEELAFATPENKRQLQAQIQVIQSQGGTQYLPALQLAMTFLEEAPTSVGDGRPRGRVLLLYCFISLRYLLCNSIIFIVLIILTSMNRFSSRKVSMKKFGKNLFYIYSFKLK